MPAPGDSLTVTLPFWLVYTWLPVGLACGVFEQWVQRLINRWEADPSRPMVFHWRTDSAILSGLLGYLMLPRVAILSPIFLAVAWRSQSRRQAAFRALSGH